jgi:hypothetical protein
VDVDSKWMVRGVVASVNQIDIGAAKLSDEGAAGAKAKFEMGLDLCLDNESALGEDGVDNGGGEYCPTD